VPAERVRRLRFSLAAEPEARDEVWAAAAAEVGAALTGGETAAFATIGDPNVYSTFAYLAAAVRRIVPELVVATVPGITAMQDLAARSNTSLCAGNELLALLPFATGAERLAQALDRFDTVVCYKGGRRLAEVLAIVEESGRLDEAVYGARLGLDGEEVLPAREVRGTSGPYLSTLIVGPRPGARRSA
ncbi:MAG: precorrin-2 C(20)-methyltransferase, partial [Gaiellaceae bacterium]